MGGKDAYISYICVCASAHVSKVRRDAARTDTPVIWETERKTGHRLRKRRAHVHALAVSGDSNALVLHCLLAGFVASITR